MGSTIEINDTLKISIYRGFPKELSNLLLRKDDEPLRDFLGKEFEFWNNHERLYHMPPTRFFLVEEKFKKWIYWGNALVISQTIKPGITKGIFKITKLYNKEFQKKITIEESPAGKSHYPGERSSYIINNV